MTFFVFLILPLILVYPAFSKSRFTFVDIYLILCLYFDAGVALVGNQKVNFAYGQAGIFLLFSINYFLTQMNSMNAIERKYFYSISLYVIATLVFPLLKGVGWEPILKMLIPYDYTMLILPIAFHHYSTKGDIRNLFKICGMFIIFWFVLVGIFTLFKIDAIREGNLGARTFGMGVIYFGEMAGRGAISYMGLFLLLIPAVIPNLSQRWRTLFIVSCGFTAAILLLALKRFTLIALVLGFLNYLLNTKIDLTKKALFIVIGILMLLPMFIFTDLGSLTEEQYYKRKGEEKYSVNAVTGDLRVTEPLYVATYNLQGGLVASLIGRQTTDIMAADILWNEYTIVERAIHNQYARNLLIYGFIGLALYLTIFYQMYQTGSRLNRIVKHYPGYNRTHWMVFQNIVIIFFLGGIAAPNIAVTYRGMVFLIAGAICGQFYKLHYDSNKNLTKEL